MRNTAKMFGQDSGVVDFQGRSHSHLREHQGGHVFGSKGANGDAESHGAVEVSGKFQHGAVELIFFGELVKLLDERGVNGVHGGVG